MFSDTLPEHLNANRFIDATEEISGPLEPQHYKRFSEMATLLPGGRATIRGSREHMAREWCLGSFNAKRA